MEHAAPQLPVSRCPGFRRVDVTHEEKISEEQEREDDDRNAQERFLEEAKGAVETFGFFHSGSV
jgi:hypothetical protein